MVRFLFALALLTGPLALDAAAQNVPPPAAELSLGWVGFPDDGDIVNETMVGGTVRWYLTRQVSVGPEVVYIKGPGHSHLMVTGTYVDVVPPAVPGCHAVPRAGAVCPDADQLPGVTFRSTMRFQGGRWPPVAAEVHDRALKPASVGRRRVNGFIGVHLT